MFTSIQLLGIIAGFIAILFGVAYFVEQRKDRGVGLINNPWIYSLSLSVYCTTWTFYGSVGNAASSGFLFITIYLGPTLCIILWPIILRRLIRMKEVYRVTSIADLIVARYGKSQALGTLVATMCLIGIIPYIALQIKGFTTGFSIITGNPISNSTWNSDLVGPIISLFMIAFTIMFGIRKLDPSERHPGMMMALTIEAVIKLVAFISVGVFVVYVMHDGIADVFTQMPKVVDEKYSFMGTTSTPNFIKFFTYTLLAASAILFLPRQFHVTVVENQNPKFIKTAMWLFPLYLFAINIFVLPIAIGGLLQGGTAKLADAFVLNLPLQAGFGWLTALVFIGGFSAGTGMIMIETMTVSAMVSNYHFLPIIQKFGFLAKFQRQILKIRWLSAFLIISAAYIFQRLIGDSYPLVAMGVISFAAVLQFAPSILFGLFWAHGSVKGAITGLSLGFGIWLYTLMIPAFMKGGLLPKSILENGPWNLSWLKPEALFGLEGLDIYSNSVLWSMLFNIGGYVVISLIFENTKSEQELATDIVNIMKTELDASSEWALVGSTLKGAVEKKPKYDAVVGILSRFFSKLESTKIAEKCFLEIGCSQGETVIPILKLTDLYKVVERHLAASIGNASAHLTMQNSALISGHESESLAQAYGDMLANLKISPIDLNKKINYFQDRQNLMQKQAQELEIINRGLEKEVEDRTEEVREQMKNTKVLLDNIHQAVFAVDESALVVAPVSEHTHQVMGINLGGRNVLDTLFKDIKRSSEAYGHIENIFNIIFAEEDYQWDIVKDLLPHTIPYQCISPDGETVAKTLKVSYQGLFNHDGKLNRVLFVVEDITEILKLESERERNIRQVEILQNISSLEVHQLKIFFKSSRQLLEAIQTYLDIDKIGSLRSNIPVILRSLHTLKGNARVYGLYLVSTVIHEVEGEITQLQKVETQSLLDFHKSIKRYTRAIQSVVFDYSRSALKYLHFESDFELGFFRRLHDLICELENKSPWDSKTPNTVEEIIDIVELLALSQQFIADLHDFYQLLASRDQVQNEDQFEARFANLLHSMRIELLERRLLPPFPIEFDIWSEIIVRINQISCLAKNHPNPFSSEEWNDSNIYIEVQQIAAKANIEAITWLARESQRCLIDGNLPSYLRKVSIFIALFCSFRSKPMNREKDAHKIEELFHQQSEDLHRAKIITEELTQTDSFIVYLSQVLCKNGVHPQRWLTNLRSDSKDIIKNERFIFGSEIEDVLFEQFSQPQKLEDCLQFVHRKWSSIRPLDILINRFFQSNLTNLRPLAVISDIDWSYLKASELSRMIVACTLDKQPNLIQSKIATMEVICSHVNQARQLCDRYRLDPNSFSQIELASSLDRLLELPIKPLFEGFYPMIQELASKYGKKIQFEVVGEEVCFHRERFTIISDLFTHLIRNGIDHAIEPVEERRGLGKPETGKITIECQANKNSVTFIIVDDGRGINPEDLAIRAVKQDLISMEELDAMDATAKINLIFLHGLSTKVEVNEISGRGIGLDVVKNNIAQLQGSIEVTSTIGVGTKFTIGLNRQLEKKSSAPKLLAGVA